MKWQEAIDFGRTEAARQYLTAIVKRYGGRIADAAAHAGVERESFYRLLRKYDVQPDGTLVAPEAQGPSERRFPRIPGSGAAPVAYRRHGSKRGGSPHGSCTDVPRTDPCFKRTTRRRTDALPVTA